VPPVGDSRRAKVHWNSKPSPSSRVIARPAFMSACFITSTSSGTSSTTIQPLVRSLSEYTMSPTASRCQSGTIESALWIRSPNRFSNQS
jgi:hypothetical protein